MSRLPVASVVVVGSINRDLVARVPHLPGPGETVLATGHLTNPGGKGANQAVAAARLGQPVAFVGCVGDDDAGRTLLDALHADGIDTGNVQVRDGPSGLAIIAVDDDGENTIVVSGGANLHLTEGAVREAAPKLGAAVVTLAQLEIPVEAVAAAARLAGGRFVLNPAPARALPAELLSAVDVLVPNLGELATLAGAESQSVRAEDAAELAGRLEGPGAVVVTLGAGGALVVQDGQTVHVPAPVVDAVDTTAAGDAFCAALADGLVRDLSLVDAATWAVRVAARTVTRAGAQQSLPRREDVG